MALFCPLDYAHVINFRKTPSKLAIRRNVARRYFAFVDFS